MKMLDIPPTNPRAESLRIRGRLIEAFEEGLVVDAGLLAQGRGEAFDYLLGEKTIPPARKAIRVAAATLLLAKHPVISVNGNVAALTPREVVELAEEVGGKIEVNLFYRSLEREVAIRERLKLHGARDVLGVGGDASARIPELESMRRMVDPRGILMADVVMVPLEDGDRTEALIHMGKTVVAVDLNPLSRTAQKASITIVDNLVRAMPLLIREVRRMKGYGEKELFKVLKGFDNHLNLQKCISVVSERLLEISGSRVKRR